MVVQKYKTGHLNIIYIYQTFQTLGHIRPQKEKKGLKY